MKPLPRTLAAIGIIRRPHGVRGEMSVAPLYDGGIEDLAGLDLEFDPPVAGHPSARVTGIRTHGSRWLVTIDGIETPEQVRLLSGRRLVAPAEKLPASRADSPYHFELIGLDVVDSHGKVLGKVNRVDPSPGGDLLILDDAGDLMIPFRPMVISIDRDEGKILVELPEGLLDVNRRTGK